MVSKIDDFNTAKRKSDRLSSFAKTVQDSHNADKFGAIITLKDDHLGYYGSSSVGSWGDEVRNEVIKQIGIELRGIVLRASKRVENETEAVKRMAVEEAKAVLIEIGEGSQP